jgi:hypothetical protein
MGSIDEGALISPQLHQGQAGKPEVAWVVYSTNPSREIAAAFSDQSVAETLHSVLSESEPPVLADVSDIDVTIDQFADQVKNGATPYLVVLENGEVSREDTYESEIFGIRKPTFEPGHPEIFACTYWAFSIQDAIESAEIDWRKHSKN